MSIGDFDLRTPIEAARRALAIYATITRLNIEHSWGWGEEEISENEADVLRDRLLEWLEDEGILAYAGEAELEIIEAEIGDLEEWQIVEGSYRVEALSVLLWALERMEDIGPFDEGVAEEELTDELPQVQTPADDFLDYANTRPEEDLAREMKLVTLWRERAKFFESEDEEGGDGPSAPAAELIKQALAEGVIERTIDGDLEVFDKPYYKLSREEFEGVRLIAAERLKAFNWLFGLGGTWERTPSEKVS